MLVGGVVVSVIALVAGTWALATIFQSPAQREAAASAPPPQPVFASVTKGSLADQRSYSGTVTYSDEAGYTLTASDAVRSVVTGNPAPAGRTVNSGELLTEVNTRPVFLVASPFGFFRDIGVGDEGADVRVLQQALVDRGYLGNADEKFGGQTALAVTRWYRDSGYAAPTRARESEASSGAADASGTGPDATSELDSNTPEEAVAPGAGSAPRPAIDAYVPFSELLAIPSLPATVIAAPGIGAAVGGEALDLTLGTDTLIVRFEVPASEAAEMSSGDPVTVMSDSGQVDAVVTGNEPQPPGEDGAPRPSLLTVGFETDPTALESGRGSSVTVQVQQPVVEGESLIVPTAAVVGRGEDRGVVVKRQTDGSLIEVPVTVAGSLRGATAVVSDDAEALTEGDEVRVG